jgi:hypothetical protein
MEGQSPTYIGPPPNPLAQPIFWAGLFPVSANCLRSKHNWSVSIMATPTREHLARLENKRSALHRQAEDFLSGIR